MMLASVESSAKQTKHIDVKYHHIKDLVHSKKINITNILWEEQLADIFIKPLPRESVILWVPPGRAINMVIHSLGIYNIQNQNFIP